MVMSGSGRRGARRKCGVRLLAAALVVVLAAAPAGAETTASQAGAPSAPTGLGGTVSWDRAELIWDDPGDPAVVSYQVLRRDKALQGVGEFSVLVDDTGNADTGFTDDTVEPERRYVYRVKARSVAGLSEWSHWFNANTPAGPGPPGAPTGLAGSVGHDSAVLTWDDPGDPAVVGYQVLRRDKALQSVGEFSVLVDDTGNADTGFTDDTVEPERRYVYRVKARSVAGLSEWSHWFNANTPVALVTSLVLGETRSLAVSSEPEYEVVWSSVLSVGTLLGGVPGYQNYQGPSYAQGSLLEDRFVVDDEPVRVIAVFNHAGLVLGLSRELPRDFVLRAGSREFVASDSSVQAMGSAQGRYWWPTAPMGWSEGDEVELTIAISDSDSISPRPPAPPSAYFDDTPTAHDGVSPFEVRLIFDHANLAIDAATLKDHALAVTGADIADVRKYSPASKQSWVVTLQPTGPGGITVTLPATVDCAQPDAVCTNDARGLRHRVETTIQGSADASLRSLDIDGAVIDPVFDPGETLYAAAAAPGVSQVTVAAEAAAAGAGATVSITPADADPVTAGHQVDLNPVGETAVAVAVTAADGVTVRTYWVVAGDASATGAPSSTLNNLQFDGLAHIDFDPQQNRYEMSAPPGVSYTTVVTSRTDSGTDVDPIVARALSGPSTLEVDHDDADPSAPGHQAQLSDTGDTLIIVRTTSGDQMLQRVYLTHITNPDPNPAPHTNPGPGSDAPALSVLGLSSADVTPAFAPATHEYTATVDHDVSEVTVEASTVDADASLLMVPADADSNVSGHQVALGAPGSETSIVVIVSSSTAQLRQLCGQRHAQLRVDGFFG